MPFEEDVSRLLGQLGQGERDALDRLFPLLYAELRRMARRQLARERPDHTLDSVALVNEAYLRLADHGRLECQNRAHFFAVAARAMRAVLVDHARARIAAKRGGGAPPLPLDGLAAAIPQEHAEHLIALDQALHKLAAVNAQASQTVECRYFGGLTLEEVAAVMNLSIATVRRRWSFAKAWLQRELREAS